MKIYWFMLLMVLIQTTWSAVVTITPEGIAIEAGTDSVNFTCTVQLEIIEVTSEHWIVWYKNSFQNIVNNDTVHTNPEKYSVYGVSSAASTHYTQTLQIHDIDEDDNGTYTCTVSFPSYPLFGGSTGSISSTAAWLSTYLGIPQPTCFNQTGIRYPTMVTLFCSCPSSYSQTILQWFDNEGNELTSPPAIVTNTNIILTASFPVESYQNSQWYTCRATIPGSTQTKECVIGNKNLTSVTTVTDNSITRTTNGINIPETITTINRVATTTITQNQSPSPGTTHVISTVETKITRIKNISHTPSISELISDVGHHMQTENTSGNSADNKLSSSTIISIIIPVVLAVILLVIFIIMLITVGKRKKTKTQNEEIDFYRPKHWLETTTSSYDNEITEEETAINSGIQDHQVIAIQFDDVDNQLEYKNSAFETNTDDPDPSYAAVNHTTVDKSQINKKISNSGLLSIGNTDDPYQAVGPAGNIGQQCPMTDMADYQKNKALLEGASEYMSTADMEFKRKPPVPAKKPNKSTKSKVINYQAPNGDMYAQVDKSSKSISNRITTLLRNEEHLREKEKETERNDKLINLTKASIRFMDIDNDDTYSTVSDVIPSKVDEENKKETEMNENGDGEDDNVSRTSLDSTGSIHYSVDDDTVYARVLKQQKLTT